MKIFVLSILSGCLRQVLLYCLCEIDVTGSILWLFLTVEWVGLQCVINVFPGHTYFIKLMKLALLA